MDLGISGKRALILASSKGLGKAVALELASEGCKVMICSRTETDLVATKNEIESKTNSTVYYATANVATSDGRAYILSEAKKLLGSIDILVTNSGGPPLAAFESHSEEAWGNAYKLLLESTVGIIRGVLPNMKAHRWGRIITITSQAVKQPVNGLILSNSIRSSIVGLVKTLSNELGVFNITVNNVMPGYTQTERLENLMAKNPDLHSITDEIPLGRIGQPSEFASAVTFLASQKASYITGISLAVDGGWIKGV